MNPIRTKKCAYHKLVGYVMDTSFTAYAMRNICRNVQHDIMELQAFMEDGRLRYRILDSDGNVLTDSRYLKLSIGNVLMDD
jgi:hypothetical protein